MPKKETKEEWIERFEKEVPGYSMNIYGDNPVIRPIMVQREDAFNFIQKEIDAARLELKATLEREEWKKKYMIIAEQLEKVKIGLITQV